MVVNIILAGAIPGASVAVTVGLTVAAIPVGLVVGEGLAVATGRRPTTVSRMAVSVKFAGAISVGTVVALTTASVGGGSVLLRLPLA